MNAFPTNRTQPILHARPLATVRAETRPNSMSRVGKLATNPHFRGYRIAAVFGVLFGLMTNVHAATLTVCKQGCEHTSINSAVAASASGDTIDVGAGTYQENVVITDKNLTITGASEDQTVIDGGFHGAALTITGTTPAQSKVAVNKLTLLHGSASGIAVSQTTLSLYKIILISNVSGAANGSNGAGIIATGSQVDISTSIIAHNRVPTGLAGLGGGIYAGNYSVFTIESSDIFDNTAAEGGGLYIDSESAITLTASTLTRNIAKNGGGVSLGAFRHLSVERIGFLTANHSTVANNSASDFGGALYVPIEEDGASFNHSLVVGNTAGNQGGAIYFAEDGSADLSNTTFAGNQPDNCSGGVPCP